MSTADRLPTDFGTIARALVSPTTERQREHRRIIGLSIPFVLLAVFGGIIPLWEMTKISVSTSQFTTSGFTLEYYRQLLSVEFGYYVFNTVWFATVTTIASVGIGVAISHALEKYDLPFEGLLVTLISFPISLPGIVAAFMMIILFGNTGLVTNFATWLTAEAPLLAPLLADSTATDLAVATGIVGLFFGYCYSMIPRATFLLRGSYAEVNTDAEEAARALGASPLATFRYVTLPQIRPGIVGAFILTFRTATAIFGTVLVLKALDVLTLRISRLINVSFNIQAASAMSVVFFIFTLVFTFVGLRYTSAEVGGS
jgi:putative spermidine/putrescine transport system permease protein